MSVEREILEYLSKNKNKTHIRYRGIKTSFLGLPDFQHYKYQTLANKCSNLKSKGYIQAKNGNHFITHKGEDFLNKKVKTVFKNFISIYDKNTKKDLLVLYDIPEDKKSERDWFRRQLRNLHFIMIQRSVWVGPSPLPKEFLDYVKEIRIGDSFKTFKLSTGYKAKE
jgi:DNA-binding transcriptional regulator PaaX